VSSDICEPWGASKKSLTKKPFPFRRRLTTERNGSGHSPTNSCVDEYIFELAGGRRLFSGYFSKSLIFVPSGAGAGLKLLIFKGSAAVLSQY
jgi:hypothetical protein